MPINSPDDLPSTIRRSDEHAQAIFTETLNSAEGTYGPGERARRTAFASLKHSYEKVGDHWERKAHKGPSDEQAARGVGEDSVTARETAGGVDAKGHTKAELLERARSLGLDVKARMTKDELVVALERYNDRETRHARERERERAKG
jgi:cation transport regulator ChaB